MTTPTEQDALAYAACKDGSGPVDAEEFLAAFYRGDPLAIEELKVWLRRGK